MPDLGGGAPNRPSGTALAVALLTMGLAILIPSGLCTGVVGIMALWNGNDASEFGGLQMVGLAMMVGGPFILVGVVLIFFGRKRLNAVRSRTRPRAPGP